MQEVLDELLDRYTDIFFLDCPNSPKPPVKSVEWNPIFGLNTYSPVGYGKTSSPSIDWASL